MAQAGIHLYARVLICYSVSETGIQECYFCLAALWSHESDQLCVTVFHWSHHLFPNWSLPCTLLRIYAESCCCHVYVPVADAFLQMVAKVAQARPTRVPMAQMDLGTLKSEAINQ